MDAFYEHSSIKKDGSIICQRHSSIGQKILWRCNITIQNLIIRTQSLYVNLKNSLLIIKKTFSISW